MKSVPNRTWKSDVTKAEKIKQWLISQGAIQDSQITNPYEAWRLQHCDATFTYYQKGTLYVTDSNDQALERAHHFVDSLLGPQFVPPTKDLLIGFDETGKGELLGDVVLAGVLVPNEIFNSLGKIVGSADTKTNHTVEYWEQIVKKLKAFCAKGLQTSIGKITPQQFDQFNINRLLDTTYQKIIQRLGQRLDWGKTRLVIDDYGVGDEFQNYLTALRSKGAEVIVAPKADDQYLECRLASLVSKREQKRQLESIIKNPQFQIKGKSIGSGNAGDSKTLQWLKVWHRSGKKWPPFVKRSFKTIRVIEG